MRDRLTWSRTSDKELIARLVERLGEADGLVRESARKALVGMGARATPALVQALRDERRHVRWEAAKAMGSIGDASAAEALVDALEDESSEVRWLAAESLAGLWLDALPPLLQALIERSSSAWLRQGAHQALTRLSAGRLRASLQPLRDALEKRDAAVKAPIVAEQTLRALTSRRGWLRASASGSRR